MAQLSTVQDYVTDARVLLQDKVEPYRYPDADLIAALNLAVIVARGKRPDVFLEAAFVLPTFVVADIAAATAFDIDKQVRLPFLYYIVGHAQLRDDEENMDARASAFLGKFEMQLTGMKG